MDYLVTVHLIVSNFSFVLFSKYQFLTNSYQIIDFKPMRDWSSNNGVTVSEANALTTRTMNQFYVDTNLLIFHW